MIEGFDYQTLDHQKLAREVKLADDYLFQLIDVIGEDTENEENKIAVQQLTLIHSVLRDLRLAYYGRVAYEDRTWEYGDEINDNKMIDLIEFVEQRKIRDNDDDD